MRPLLLFCWLCAAAPVWAQGFEELRTGLPEASSGVVQLGDLDLDGDLDVLLAGNVDRTTPATLIFRNDGRTGDRDWSFTPIDAGLPGLLAPSAAFADYDRDGDLDLVLTGTTPTLASTTRLYRNDGDFTFTPVAGADLPGVNQEVVTGYYRPSVAWGDYDGDGDLDLLLTGSSEAGTLVTAIYRNEGGDTFTRADVDLPPIGSGAVTWGDYDGDNDLDLLVANLTLQAGDPPFTRIYANQGDDTFVDIEAGLPGITVGSVTWGDYDADGDLDVLVMGLDGSNAGSPEQGIYTNERGTFRRLGAALPVAQFGAWADFDNDGLPDLLLATANATEVLRNEAGNRFATPLSTLPGLWFASLAVGDLDRDGRLDLVTMGQETIDGNTAGAAVRLYRNTVEVANTPPAPPAEVRARFEDDELAITWKPGSDLETPAEALTYNVAIGTTPGGTDILSPMALPSGTPLLPGPGNAGARLSYILQDADPGLTYFVRVQALDQSYAASPFVDLVLEPDVSVTTEGPAELPLGARINAVYPNPFHERTTVSFTRSVAGPVELAIYDALGRLVRRLDSGVQPAGLYQIAWDGLAANGRMTAAGLYHCVLDTPDGRDVRHLVRLR